MKRAETLKGEVAELGVGVFPMCGVGSVIGQRTLDVKAEARGRQMTVP